MFTLQKFLIVFYKLSATMFALEGKAIHTELSLRMYIGQFQWICRQPCRPSKFDTELSSSPAMYESVSLMSPAFLLVLVVAHPLAQTSITPTTIKPTSKSKATAKAGANHSAESINFFFFIFHYSPHLRP